MEETVEEMESEDRVVSNKGKSLNDLFLNLESGATVTPPYLTPLASPSLFTPPFTPLMESCNGKKEEISSFFELSTDAEDAEEKLYKRKVMEIVESEELKG
ncbi:unnamed protein product [Arabis nemorensis]|uniref:Uncharacterized protein n=1 Tax=Arabis nemorensis TaxID=586526 RepID=A0A565BM68_9BRAS|nr:unnamed protein product [Arabis nemorensis]